MISDRYLVIGTRCSKLALWQAEFVAARLREVLAGIPIVILPITTSGDRDLSMALPELGGNALFTDDLESALRHGEIDLAVHSLKDMPLTLAEEFVIAAVPQRASPYDALINHRQHQKLHELPLGARIGTDSLRRSVQIKALRPDVEIVPLRGTIPMRLDQLLAADSPYDALVLAVAGLERLRLLEHITEIFPPEVMLPAPGQGAIAVQCRANDNALRRVLTRIDDVGAHIEVEAERALVSMLAADRELPVAALARFNHDEYTLSLTGRVLSASGETSFTVHSEIDLLESDLTIHNEDRFQRALTTAHCLGQELAAQAIQCGAGDLLATHRNSLVG